MLYKKTVPTGLRSAERTFHDCLLLFSSATKLIELLRGNMAISIQPQRRSVKGVQVDGNGRNECGEQANENRASCAQRKSEWEWERESETERRKWLGQQMHIQIDRIFKSIDSNKCARAGDGQGNSEHRDVQRNKLFCIALFSTHILSDPGHFS